MKNIICETCNLFEPCFLLINGQEKTYLCEEDLKSAVFDLVKSNLYVMFSSIELAEEGILRII